MKKQLTDYMSSTGMNQSQVAKALGVSSTTISLYLKGIYNGRTGDIDDAVARLIKRYKDKVVERQFNTAFVPTLAAKRCLDVVRFAHVEGDINVITGAAGLGKTQALKHYIRKNPDVVMIEVEPSCSPKVLLKAICNELGLSDIGLNHDLFARITDKLCLGRLLIVDEAELLSTKSLEYLRRLHDLTGVGVVLAGMPRLIVNLKGKFGELAQLYSRVGLACDLGNSLTKDDIALLAEQGLGTSKHNDELFRVSNGNARRLNKLMRGVVRVAQMNEREIDGSLIKSYADMLIS